MKAQVIFISDLKTGTSKKTNKPYEGYFVDMLYKDDTGNIRYLDTGYLDKSLVGDQKVGADTMVDLNFNYRGFLEGLKVLPDEPPFMLRG